MLMFGKAICATCWTHTLRTTTAAPASSAAAASAAPGSGRLRAGLRQDPASTDPRRPHQPVRGRSLKPLVTRRGQVLEPHMLTAGVSRPRAIPVERPFEQNGTALR